MYRQDHWYAIYTCTMSAMWSLICTLVATCTVPSHYDDGIIVCRWQLPDNRGGRTQLSAQLSINILYKTQAYLKIYHLSCLSVQLFTQDFCFIPYGGKLWRVQTLAKLQGKHHWRNKLWRIDDESLIKRILKQFEDTSAPNLHICARVCL